MKTGVVKIGNSKTVKEMLAENPPEEMSIQEKTMLCLMVECEDELPYPLKPLKMKYGNDELVYEIPKKDKKKIFKEIWPFGEMPDMNDELYDIHAGKMFVMKDYQVIRYNRRNLVVSPYYAETGGMAVDFVPKEHAEEYIAGKMMLNDTEEEME